MTTKTLTALALVLAAVPAMSWAQEGRPMRHQPPQIDFAAADADGSGGISAEEWTAYVTSEIAVRRAEAMSTRADALIGAGDANGDGMLDRDEVIAGFTILGDQRREMRANRHAEGDGGGWMRGHGRRGHDGDRGEMRGHHGHDGDRAERRGGGAMEPGQRAGRAFERIDANGDGQIDAAELAAMQEMMQRRMERRNN